MQTCKLHLHCGVCNDFTVCLELLCCLVQYTCAGRSHTHSPLFSYWHQWMFSITPHTTCPPWLSRKGENKIWILSLRFQCQSYSYFQKLVAAEVTDKEALLGGAYASFSLITPNGGSIRNSVCLQFCHISLRDTAVRWGLFIYETFFTIALRPLSWETLNTIPLHKVTSSWLMRHKVTSSWLVRHKVTSSWLVRRPIQHKNHKVTLHKVTSSWLVRHKVHQG